MSKKAPQELHETLAHKVIPKQLANWTKISYNKQEVVIPRLLEASMGVNIGRYRIPLVQDPSFYDDQEITVEDLKNAERVILRFSKILQKQPQASQAANFKNDPLLDIAVMKLISE